MLRELTMLKDIFFILVLLVVFPDLRAQSDSFQKPVTDSVEIVKALMRKTGSVTSYATGYAGIQSRQFQRFVYLVDHLNPEHFLEITRDTSTCLRIYAYAGLTYCRYKKISLIKQQFKNDSTLIPFMTGCVGGNRRASEIVFKLQQWYSKKAVEFTLREQTRDRTFWYSNYVFRD